MSRLPSFAAVALLAMPLAARAADIFVPGDHSTVQAAIVASADGDTIHIAAGTWPGALDTLDRAITLQGAGAELTIIDGLGASKVLIGSAGLSSVFVNDLTLTGGVTGAWTPPGSGILKLTRCTVRDMSSQGANGMLEVVDCSFLDNGGTGLFRFLSAVNCTFKGNGNWGAEELSGQYGTIVDRCRFLGNAAGGLRMAATGGLFPNTITVTRCVFAGDNLQLSAFEAGGVGECNVIKCSFDGAVIKLMQGAMLLDHCIVRGSTLTDFSAQGGISAVWSDIEGGWPGLHIIDADPMWTDPGDDDYSLQPGSPCINAGDPLGAPDADGSVADLGAVPFHPWTLLGTEVALLEGLGPLAAGEELTLVLKYARPSTPAWLLLGFSELGTPFKGGTLWPNPEIVAGPIVTTQFGTLLLTGEWPSGLPTGFSFWSQFWWQEPGNPAGWGSSNGLRGVQP